MITDSITRSIQKKLGIDLVDILATRLTGSELNSLLMKVFAERAAQLSPADLLRSYETNRFAQPAETDFILLLQKSEETLRVFSERGFVPRQVSPLVPLGTCSVVGVVDQNKIVSATRNGEVLADATNALALEIAAIRKRGKKRDALKFCTVQRHMRAQAITVKGFSPHFTIGCLVTAGRDTGSFGFEFSTVTDHLLTMSIMLRTVFGINDMHIKLQQRGNYPAEFLDKLARHVTAELSPMAVHVDRDATENTYYHGVQFKVVINKIGRQFEIADGGLVDWTQKLLNDRKERYCISGFGLELLNKMDEGLL